jgi:hypothetical protein
MLLSKQRESNISSPFVIARSGETTFDNVGMSFERNYRQSNLPFAN